MDFRALPRISDGAPACFIHAQMEKAQQCAKPPPGGMNNPSVMQEIAFKEEEKDG